MNSSKSPRRILACALVLLLPSVVFAIEADKKLERLDRNDDGRISRSEHAVHAERMFKKMDANRDGIVTLAELRELKEDKYDKRDKDGKHDKKKKHEKRLYGDQTPAEKFKVLDQNGDGRLTESEHEEACERRFKKIDRNNDNEISESELEEAMD